MRTNRIIVWLIAVVAVLVALLVWLGKKTPLAAVAETNPAPPIERNASTEASQPAATSSPQASSPNVPNLPNQGKQPGESKAEQVVNVLSNYNDMPIVFYGRLEDQFTNAVENAVVDFSVRVINGYTSTTERGQVLSDARGLFTISGYKGQDLSVNPKKTGYALASKNGWVNYSQLFPEEERAHPDPSNPVLIEMWKLQGAEPLVGFDKDYKLRYTDAPVYFDLPAGKVVPAGGDIKITVNRAPGVMSGRTPLDWSVKVEAVNGALLETSMAQSRVTYAAPESGYQPSATFIFSTNVPYKWFGGFDQMFFVSSRNGQAHSKVLFSFTINQDPDGFMYAAFRGVANTNGSRNWEGDPNTYAPR